MKENSNELLLKEDREITYLRFINGTLQAKKLKEEVCDKFTRLVGVFPKNHKAPSTYS